MLFRLPSLFVLLLFFYIPQHASGSTIKGYVYDAITGEPLANATVHLTSTNIYTIAGLDGSFAIRNIPAGKDTIQVSYTAYQTYTRPIHITPNEVYAITIKLKPASERSLTEVTVAASKEDIYSREPYAPQIMNSVSARAIELSPDITVASVLQRLSGVSIERDNTGNAQHAILRGMDKRYNYTLVNGIKMPSPDKAYRYIPLDIFPSELAERLEVYKTLTPDMEGDAIGGVVNMVMKKAAEKTTFNVHMATGYNTLFLHNDFMHFDHNHINSQSPYQRYAAPYNALPSDFSSGPLNYTYNHFVPNIIAGISAGKRFLNNRLGVMIAGSMQNIHSGSNSIFFDAAVVDTLRGVTLTNMKERHFSEQEVRYGIYANMDYRLNGKNTLQWNNVVISQTDMQVRDSKTTLLTIGGYDAVNGNATLEYDTRSRIGNKKIYNHTVQGNHQLSNELKLNWSAVYALAKSNQPDNTTSTLNGEERNFASTRTTVKDAFRRWDHNSDRDISGYLTITYIKPIGDIPVEWTVGSLYRNKHRTNFYNSYDFRPVDAYYTYGKDFTDYTQIPWIVENPRGSIATSLNYNASEKITAAFFQFKIAAKKVQATGGLRIEHTNQGYGLQYPIGESRPYGQQVYTDILPSLNIKYMPTEKTNIRAAYFRSINRPGFFEIVPYTIVNEDYVERGNPDLKHAVADNFDIRLERFPRPAEQLMAAIFYKHIQNPIEYTLQPDSIRGQDIYYMPGNFGNAVNYGAEIDYVKYFNQLGVKLNYTYTHSHITTTKSKRIREDNGDLKTIPVTESRPLYMQPAHIANISLLYKDGNRKWDAQLALQYTGERIHTVSQFVGNDLWQKASVHLDASLEKGFKNGLSVFAKGNNLLNTPMMVYTKNTSFKNAAVPGQTVSGKTLFQRDYYQLSFLIGARYKW